MPHKMWGACFDKGLHDLFTYNCDAFDDIAPTSPRHHVSAGEAVNNTAPTRHPCSALQGEM